MQLVIPLFCMNAKKAAAVAETHAAKAYELRDGKRVKVSAAEMVGAAHAAAEAAKAAAAAAADGAGAGAEGDAFGEGAH